MSSSATVQIQDITDFAARLLVAAGTPGVYAHTVAEALVDADVEGLASHGTMLLPMYLDRITAGSVAPKMQGRVISDTGAQIVIDADNGLGQIVAEKAVGIAVERARKHGLAAVAVRNAFHFGGAGRFARSIARQGCAGIVMANTRPLLPAPGGAERVVGNNPIAIAVPTATDPIVLDLALSAGAMGKIRLAESQGQTIPPGWASTSEGVPTVDPSEAIKGMLLPAAGPKGFGLAAMITFSPADCPPARSATPCNRSMAICPGPMAARICSLPSTSKVFGRSRSSDRTLPVSPTRCGHRAARRERLISGCPAIAPCVHIATPAEPSPLRRPLSPRCALRPQS
jgi:hypothetical protein